MKGSCPRCQEVVDETEYMEIDGSYGEGGGSNVRLAGAFAALTHKKVRIFNIRKLIQQKPELLPNERAELIASQLQMEAVSAAAYGRSSEDPEVKSEALKSYSILIEAKYDLTAKWRKLLDEKSVQTPLERIKSLSSNLGVKPITVAGYGRVSSDPEVKKEAFQLYYMISTLVE